MLMQMLYEAAECNPQHTALICEGERFTYADLVDHIERLAQGLHIQGIGFGASVAIRLLNSPAYVICYLALAGLGATAVPINPSFAEDELALFFQKSSLKAIITDEIGIEICQCAASRFGETIQILSTSRQKSTVVSIWDIISNHAPIRLKPVPPENDAFLMYSSGTMGEPKLVPHTQQQCRAAAENFSTTVGFSPDDIIFCPLPFFHTHGLQTILGSVIYSGSTLLLFEQVGPFIFHCEKVIRLLEDEHVTVFVGVPFIFRLLMKTSASVDLSALRLCTSTGGLLPRSTFNGFLERFNIPIRQIYGCTETSSAAINLEDDPGSMYESVGRPIQNVQIIIVDQQGISQLPGIEGEVAISSPSMTKGYIGLEELNRKVFRSNFFFTGDLGWIDQEGRLYVTGRIKLLIEVAGHKVNPNEVEQVLMTHPGVREAAVLGISHLASGEEVVKAVIVQDDTCEASDLISFCRHRLARWKVPQVIEFRKELLKSPSGKVLRKELI